jgi:hypothetical protein
MSKELGRRDGRVCQEYGCARTFVVEHVGDVHLVVKDQVA